MASSRPNTIPIYQVPPTMIDTPINWAIAGTSHMKRLMGDTTLLKMFLDRTDAVFNRFTIVCKINFLEVKTSCGCCG